ncbi:hypothetical protein ES703_96312 [subsurface metagenome]
MNYDFSVGKGEKIIYVDDLYKYVVDRYMASKNISIRSDLYKRLAKLKQKNECFSDVIERLMNEGLKGSTSRLMKYFGVWADFPEDTLINFFILNFKIVNSLNNVLPS